MEQRDWIKFVVDKFNTNETEVRCCGSCMGGCIDPIVCFVCCGFDAQDLIDYINKVGKESLTQEFENIMAT